MSLPDRIETEHNGHTILYWIATDAWACADLQLEAASLKALRDKINAVDADARRCSVPAYIIPSSTWNAPELCVITMLDRDGAKAWVQKVKGNKPVRELVVIGDLAPRSPEVDEALTRLRDAVDARKRADHAERQALAAIPRMTIDDIRAALPASLEVDAQT